VKFLVIFHHLVNEDTRDLLLPIEERKNTDVFEAGPVTGAINSQLVKDAHRAEWSIEGQGFSYAKFEAEGGGSLVSSPASPNPGSGGGMTAAVGTGPGNTRDASNNMIKPHFPAPAAASPTTAGIPTHNTAATASSPGQFSSHSKGGSVEAFQDFFVKKLENFLLNFSQAQNLDKKCERHLIQAITTQMCQCGLANLDRGSMAARVFVCGQDLEQNTVYNISTLDDSIKLSIMCMVGGVVVFPRAVI